MSDYAVTRADDRIRLTQIPGAGAGSMTAPRLCANPACRAPLDAQRVQRHNARTCDDKCRAAAWKAAVGYGKRSAPRKPRANGRRQPDLRINYRKAVEKVTEELLSHELVSPPTPTSARVVAEVWLRPLLSDAQRARLDAREDHTA